MKNRIETDLLIGELIYKYLRHQISRDEQEILDSWAESEENQAFFSSLKESDRLYSGLINLYYQDKEAQFLELQRRIRRRKYRNLWKLAVGTAAVLTLVIGSVLFFQREKFSEKPPFMVQLPGKNQTFLRTPEGETFYLADSVKEISHREQNREKDSLKPEIPEISDPLKYNILVTSSHGKIEVMLTDSTRVWLNTGSELRYPAVFNQDERKVFLKGEAYFEVAKDLHCPFVVRTETVQLEVLGTQFNINAYGNTPCVTTLVEGCVKMQNQMQDTIILYPGQQAVAGRERGIQIREVDVRYYIAWKKNQFAFQDATLFQIMNELADWYDFTFEFENLQLGNQTYTAIMPRFATIDEVLQLLELMEDFGYIRESGRHIRIIGK